MNKLFLVTEDEISELISKGIELYLSSNPINNSVSEKEFLTIDEAAKFIDRPKSTIYNLVSKNEIPFKKKGKRLYFLRQDLVNYIKK